MFFLSACCKKANTERKPFSTHTPEDKVWLSKFLTDVMLGKSGIYTLWGSKPMTSIQILHYSQEELDQYYKSLPEEEKSQYVEIDYEYDLNENWEKWKQLKERFAGNRFLLFHYDFIEDGKIENVYLVDLFKVALVLQNNYEYFRKIVGFDFDPIKIVYEIQDPNSIFWKIALRHSGLVGLLYGYGLQNSLGFQWKYADSVPFLKNFDYPFSDEEVLSDISLSNFHIPVFAVYDDQKAVEQYKKEREEIRKIYKGKDFVGLTLKRMTE